VTSLISLLRHWGGIGIFILAALDSSVLPTLGAVDALTILFAPVFLIFCSRRAARNWSGSGIWQRAAPASGEKRRTHQGNELALSCKWLDSHPRTAPKVTNTAD
jgi:hypothetical protein